MIFITRPLNEAEVEMFSSQWNGDPTATMKPDLIDWTVVNNLQVGRNVSVSYIQRSDLQAPGEFFFEINGFSTKLISRLNSVLKMILSATPKCHKY